MRRLALTCGLMFCVAESRPSSAAASYAGIKARAVNFISLPPGDRPAALQYLERTARAGPAHVAALVRTLVEHDSIYASDDPRAVLFNLIQREAANHATWPGTASSKYVREIADDLTTFIGRHPSRHQLLEGMIELKFKLDLFTTKDLPFFIRSMSNNGDPRLTVAFVTLFDQLTPEQIEEVRDFLDGPHPTRKSIPALAVAYLREISPNEDILKRLVAELLLDVTKTSMTSTRLGYGNLLKQDPRAAEAYRSIVSGLLTKVLDRLTSSVGEERRLILEAAMKAKPRRVTHRALYLAIERAHERLNELLTTGKHQEAFADVATYLCIDSLSWRRSP